MNASPTAGLRKLDRVLAVELAVLLAVVLSLKAEWWPAAAAVAAAGAWLLWRRSGTAAAAFGLPALVGTTAVAVAAAVPTRPALLLLLPLVLMQLSLYRRWPLVALYTVAFAAVPLLLPSPAPYSGLVGLSAFIALQGAWGMWVAHEGARHAKALFDVEFLVRAMGRSGQIRLNLGVLRAETATGQRLKDVQERVARILSQVRESAHSASDVAGTLQCSGQELTERTESSGRELSDAAMTLEQIAVIVKESADSAMSARKTAQAASALAKQVGGIVEQMVQQMQAIDQGSRRITEIIGVIDGIAFQTNLLALNAAVEAARAGTHGRGFAVVAGEVRTLAQRVSKAASEVKGLIEASVQASEQGSHLAQTAGTTMTNLVEAVERVDTTFHDLSADTNEHADGLVAIRDTMVQMRDGMQSNLRLAEQAQQIANQLAERSQRLDELLSGFSLPPMDAAGPAAAAAPPPQPETERTAEPA
ncbi:MAG: methyl-accepting chemotaxis protein [Rubrivivax sp.]|nr:methyl-accepting chemotaxis protein [Rubrivivax sp.]